SVALADFHRMQLTVDILPPKIEKPCELGKIRREVEFLPDEGLQRLRLVGQPVDDLGRGQTVSGGVRGSAHRRAFRSSRRKHCPGPASGQPRSCRSADRVKAAL